MLSTTRVAQETESEEFKCKECEHHTEEKGTLKDHMELHEALLKCPFCNLSTKSGKEINNYITATHNIPVISTTSDIENSTVNGNTNLAKS